MNKVSDKNNLTCISLLRWWQLPGFDCLRRDIENEAKHLAVGRGERKETVLHSWMRLVVNRGRLKTLVYYQDGKMIGYVTLVFPKYKKLKNNAYLTISVKRDFRGQGIGTKLMVSAEKFLKPMGIRRIELEVMSDNKRAIELYQRLGYEIEGVRRQAISNDHGYDDMVFMAKFINP